MPRIIFFLFTLLVAPALGLFAASYGTGELVESSGLSSQAEVADYCSTPEGQTEEGCEILATLQLLHKGSAIALAVSIALPLVYLLAALLLGRSRNLLARWFPPLVWVVLGILPLLLVAHGLLIWLSSWELVQLGIIPSNLKLMIFLGLLGGGLMLGRLHHRGGHAQAAGDRSAARHRHRARESTRCRRCTRVSNGWPPGWDRASRTASCWAWSRRPMWPTFPCGCAESAICRARTRSICRPRRCACWTTAELDALIGHELGHFRGEDLEFSSRFSPVFRSLGLAIESVATGEDDEHGASLATLPAIGLLSFMIYTLNRIVSRIGRQREFAADQAALEVSNPRAITSLLVKFSVLSEQWGAFRYGFGVLLHQGVGRRNISTDYITRTRQFMAAMPADDLRRSLIEAHAPHPLDTHPSLSQRAAAVGMDALPAIAPSLAALNQERPVPEGLVALEERITLIDVDYYRHPGSPVKLAEEESELPPELRFNKD